MSLKVKLYRFFLVIRNRFEKLDFTRKEKITPTQDLAIKIFDRTLLMQDSELLIAPISGTYYIQWKDIFIVLDGNELRIVNGKYEYHIFVSLNSYNRMSDKFRRILESRRKKMEESMLSKTNRSLSEILEDLSKEQ